MKTRFSLVVLTALVAVPGVVLAGWFSDERPSANAKPLSALIKQVEDAGYKSITEVEFDDGIYAVEALDANGKEVDLTVDPVSGKVAVK